ncbi:MAG TPA: HAD family hydrolase [Candidatus Limnocylindria bacterium]|nr:HAD family hydrolase [Candidatus Limnocylindria bacterium]
MIRNTAAEVEGQPVHEIRVAFIDLDGTLLGPDKTISQANRSALRSLQEAGIETVLASGRDHRDIVKIAEQTNCSPWIVSSQGAMVKNRKTGEILHELTVDRQLAVEVHLWATQRDMSTLAYTRDGVFAETETEWTRLHAQRYGRPQSDTVARLATGGLQKLLFSADAQRIPEFETQLRQVYGDRLLVVRTEPETVEILQPGAHKAHGAAAVARHLGFGPQHAAAFGDGNNDVELLRWAHHSVAMDHGWPEAKNAARHITAHGHPSEAFATGVRLLLKTDE